MMGWLKYVGNTWISDLQNKFGGVTALLKWAGIERPQRILEIGCGKGTTTSIISKNFSAASIAAIDIDKELVKRANGLGVDAIFIVENAEQLSFQNNSFDLVVQIMTFHHVQDYKKAIKEVYRVLEKGGMFILRDLAYLCDSPYSKKEFIALLEEVGFTIEKEKGNIVFSIVGHKPKLYK